VPSGPTGVQPRPLLTQDFRRKLGPKMGHDSLWVLDVLLHVTI
jgi:hypothetical protein